MTVLAEAHPNIALAKYWGKRDTGRNLPWQGSIAVTLAPLRTRVRVSLRAPGGRDRVFLAGAPADSATCARFSKFLDLVRTLAARSESADVDTWSDVPSAAGLASSSAVFAALALAASRAFGLDLDRAELSRLARQGSGSACRSIHGGFVEWLPGADPEGRDSLAVSLAPRDHWDLRVQVAVVDAGPKPISSRDAMERVVRTSPMYRGWLECAARDLPEIRSAVLARDLEALGPVVERNCLAMFATMWSAVPPIIYWKPGTLETLEVVQRLRADGIPVWFTIDAGPNVKVLCEPPVAVQVREALAHTRGVRRVFETRVGGAARWVEESGTGQGGRARGGSSSQDLARDDAQ